MLLRLLAFTLIVIGVAAPLAADNWVGKIRIPAAAPAPWPVEIGDVALDIPCPYSMSGRCDLDGFLDWQNICALYVMHNGKPALYRERSKTRHCKQYRKDGRYRVASITKSIVSLLYGEAMRDDPLLALDRPAADALARADVAYPLRDVTLRELLRMASGMKWDDHGPEAAVIRITKSGAPGDPATLEKSVSAFLPGVTFPNRGAYNYSGFDTTMIGLALNSGADGLYPQFLSQLWTEIGAGHPARWKSDESETPSPHCCLRMAPDDLAKIGQWALDGLDPKSKRREWMEASITDTHPSNLACSVDGRLQPIAYGYQWWIPPHADGGFTAIGVDGQYLHIFPKQNVVVAQLSHDRRANLASHRCGALRAHRDIADALAR